MAKAFAQPIRGKGRKALLSDIDGIARKEIKAGMDRIRPVLVKSHEIVVKDWEHQPEFKTRLVFKPTEISLFVFPAGEHKMIWIYVDQGTKPHKIEAKKAPRLAFMMTVGPDGKFMRGQYVPKTMARPARTVVGGGYPRPPTALARPLVVDHPGSEGRGFTKQIASDIEPAFKREIDAAFKRAARRINEG